MITPLSPADARILVIGNDSLADTVIQDFKSHGVQDITLLNSEGPRPGVDVKHFVQNDDLEQAAADVDYIKSFSLVLVLNQPRALELAVSDARWPKDSQDADPDLPMIISRSVQNNCKMRCQYRELPLNGGGSSNFINLSDDLLPWTDAKRALIASIVRQEFPIDEKNARFHAYLSAARAVVDFQKEKGSWPTEAEAEQVWTSVTGASSDEALRREFVDQICKDGLGSVPDTIVLLGRIISTDGLKLLTGSGHPINNVTLEEVIAIATSS